MQKEKKLLARAEAKAIAGEKRRKEAEERRAKKDEIKKK